MHKHQPRQEAELANSIIRAHDRLSAFLTSNTNTHMCLLDHSNVVGTVTDTKRHDVQPMLDHLHHRRLLRRADTTAQHRSTFFAEE